MDNGNVLDLTKLSVLELKALAYDFIGNLQKVQNDLSIINQEIAKRDQPVAAPEKTEEAANG